MAEGRKFTYDCGGEGFNCDWQYEADDEAQLQENVQAHINEHHNLADADKCGRLLWERAEN